MPSDPIYGCNLTVHARLTLDLGPHTGGELRSVWIQAPSILVVLAAFCPDFMCDSGP